jgi:hypothetical protein
VGQFHQADSAATICNDDAQFHPKTSIEPDSICGAVENHSLQESKNPRSVPILLCSERSEPPCLGPRRTAPPKTARFPKQRTRWWMSGGGSFEPDYLEGTDILVCYITRKKAANPSHSTVNLPT